MRFFDFLEKSAYLGQFNLFLQNSFTNLRATININNSSNKTLVKNITWVRNSDFSEKACFFTPLFLIARKGSKKSIQPKNLVYSDYSDIKHAFYSKTSKSRSGHFFLRKSCTVFQGL